MIPYLIHHASNCYHHWNLTYVLLGWLFFWPLLIRGHMQSLFLLLLSLLCAWYYHRFLTPLSLSCCLFHSRITTPPYLLLLYVTPLDCVLLKYQEQLYWVERVFAVNINFYIVSLPAEGDDKREHCCWHMLSMLTLPPPSALLYNFKVAPPP